MYGTVYSAESMTRHALSYKVNPLNLVLPCTWPPQDHRQHHADATAGAPETEGSQRHLLCRLHPGSARPRGPVLLQTWQENVVRERSPEYGDEHETARGGGVLTTTHAMPMNTAPRPGYVLLVSPGAFRSILCSTEQGRTWQS